MTEIQQDATEEEQLAEVKLLGAILGSPERLAPIMKHISKWHFTEPYLRAMFACADAMHEAGLTILPDAIDVMLEHHPDRAVFGERAAAELSLEGDLEAVGKSLQVIQARLNRLLVQAAEITQPPTRH